MLEPGFRLWLPCIIWHYNLHQTKLLKDFAPKKSNLVFVYHYTCVVFHYSDCDKNVMGKWEGRDWFRGTWVREAFTKKSRILETQNLLTDADSSTNTFFPLATPKGLIIFFFEGQLTLLAASDTSTAAGAGEELHFLSLRSGFLEYLQYLELFSSFSQFE